MTTLQEKVIILKKTKYSEADLILNVLTQNGTKISLIARGALKSKKRFLGGVLEPTHHVLLTFKPSKNSDSLAQVDEATLLNDFSGLRSDYDRLNLSLEFVDIVSKISLEGDQIGAVSLYNLLGQALLSLQKENDLSLFRLRFILKILKQQGVLEYESWMQSILIKRIDEELRLDIAERNFLLSKKTEIDQKLRFYLNS